MTGNSSFGLDNDKDTPSSAGYLPSFQRRPTTTLIQSTHPDLDIASPNWGGGEQQLVEVTHHRGKKKKKRQKRQESAMIPTSLQGQVIGAHPNTNPTTNIRSHIEQYAEALVTSTDSRDRNTTTQLPGARKFELPTRQVAPAALRAGPHPFYPFDNGLSFGDPFLSSNSSFRNSSEPPRAPTIPLNRPRGQFLHKGFPIFDKTQRTDEGGSMPGKAFNGSDVNHQNPNLIPLKTSQSIASGSRVPTRTPPRAIPAHIEDRRPASASVPLNHPLRLEVERIRESRARRVTVWRECAAKNPQQSQDVNWTLRKSYEKEMKEWCTDEYNILESIERIEEGESYEDVQLHPEILARCLKYDNNVKGRNAFNAPSAYGHPDYGYGTGYLSHPPYNSHYPAFHRGSSETILPSIERDSDEDDCNVEAKEKLTKPPYDPVKTLLRTMPFSHLPHRAALGLPSLPLRTRSEVVLPTRPVVDNNNDEEYLDIDKFPTHVNVIDLTRDSDPMQVAKEDVRRVFTRNDHQPSTPRIKLTAAGLAQKRLRNISSTPFGNNIDPKRRKLISDYKRSGGRHDSWTELQKFRRDPAVMGNALPEETVFSDEESNEDNNEEHNRGYKIGSV